MNKCLHCGKEIAEGRKFCSRSCSASYNNLRRERKPWTEEQRKKVQKRETQVCRFCGKLTGRKVLLRYVNGVCSECKQYLPRLKTISTFGFANGPLKDGYFRTIKQIEKEYESGESTATLSARYGLDDLVFRGYLKDIRSRAEGRRNALEQGRSELTISPRYESGTHYSWCGKKFEYRSSWERKYMEDLDKEKIPYEYEPFTIRYWDSVQKKSRVAVPDFYLPETKELIEIKSSWTYKGKEQEMKDKFSRYRELGYKPKLLLDWKYVKI